MENTKIYKIVCTLNNSFYIGSTKKSLLVRLCEHIINSTKEKASNYNCKFFQYMREQGQENFKIELIEDYPCKTKSELLSREKYWIQQLNPDLNMIRNPILTEKEKREYQQNYDKTKRKPYYKKYRENNEKKIKQYREEHKDKTKEYNKQYQEEHNDKLIEYKKQWWDKNKDRINKAKRDSRKKPEFIEIEI